MPILADCKYFVMVLYGEFGVGSSEFGVALFGRLRQQSSELQGEIIILLSSLLLSELPTPKLPSEDSPSEVSQPCGWCQQNGQFWTD